MEARLEQLSISTDNHDELNLARVKKKAKARSMIYV